MTIKTIFLDRDGVINKDKNYVYKIDDFEFIDGIFDTCLHFLSLGYQIIIVTNQSGIQRGYFDEKQYQDLTNWMLAQFNKNHIKILDIFHCPHGPKSSCNCRKPKPGMLVNAQKKYCIDMRNSWMIGDTERDISAAKLSGIRNTILFQADKKKLLNHSEAKFKVNLLEQTKIIITA